METDNFKNCANFTDDQIKNVALARGITASVCGAILLLVLVVLVILTIRPKSRDRMCGSVKKRLTIWLTAVTVLAELFQFPSFRYNSDPNYTAICQGEGFLVKYFGIVQVLFTLWMILTFFFEVCEATLKPTCIQNINIYLDEVLRCCGCKKKMLLEVGLCFVIFIIPATYAVLFLTKYKNALFSFEPWCWHQSFREDCSNYSGDIIPKIMIQIVLWNVPYGIVAFLALALFIAALCLLRCTVRKCKLGLINSIVIFVFLIVTFTMCILETAICVYLKIYRRNYAAWLVYVISAPLGQLAIPLALLVAVHLPLFCKRHKRRKRRRGQRERRNEGATVHDSSNTDVPSNTEWNPPHSEQAEAEQEERTPILHQNNPNMD